MQTILLIYLAMVTSAATAEIWEKPPYRPDENHLPKEALHTKQAQEARPFKNEDEKKNREKQNFKSIHEGIKEHKKSGQ